MILYRVVLDAEDGSYTLSDGFRSSEAAFAEARKLKSSYGEGQDLYVESYDASEFFL